MKSIYKIAFLLLLFPFISSANNKEKKHEKSKTITKEYNVNSNALVALDNSYGDLNITTWDKNRVEIEVKITVNGNDLEDVEEKLNSINVAFSASSSKVSAKTVFGKKKNSWSWWKRSKNVNYKINYFVKMPKTNNINLKNDYGSIYLGNISGEATINCDYGKIVVGELSSNNNNISLDYCSTSTIAYIKSGDINVDYSKLSIENSEKLKPMQIILR
ncbi:hypothetical protein JL193_03085 [Polaribacter batillariae]|uniref:Adhesin domain-containing protein n=1 Tax=Polaribacter batillariae TaxID=2808900 RepID=A0ABX7SVM1_9FLAO|nr:hypothetical protein [Polaribacter batillariae]QTD38300.1 hypothetical protein JL193_03085 [Polaribacter batillariae]